MRDSLTASEDTVEIALHGGPVDIARTVRASAQEILERKIKIPHRDGYEHFEFAADPASAAPITFRWTMRTKIAE
jgi:Family of unknown function (DUF5988)